MKATTAADVIGAFERVLAAQGVPPRPELRGLVEDLFAAMERVKRADERLGAARKEVVEAWLAADELRAGYDEALRAAGLGVAMIGQDNVYWETARREVERIGG